VFLPVQREQTTQRFSLNYFGPYFGQKLEVLLIFSAKFEVFGRKITSKTSNLAEKVNENASFCEKYGPK